jgi:hypothetical protein
MIDAIIKPEKLALPDNVGQWLTIKTTLDQLPENGLFLGCQFSMDIQMQLYPVYFKGISEQHFALKGGIDNKAAL